MELKLRYTGFSGYLVQCFEVECKNQSNSKRTLCKALLQFYLRAVKECIGGVRFRV